MNWLRSLFACAPKPPEPAHIPLSALKLKAGDVVLLVPRADLGPEAVNSIKDALDRAAGGAGARFLVLDPRAVDVVVTRAVPAEGAGS